MDDLHDTVATWTSLSDPAVAEMAAGAGFDFVVVDTEHAPLGLETVADCLRAVEAGGGASMVRVPWNDPVRIKRLLDLGPDALLVPMVGTAAEAREAVAATRYPPEGERGVAAARAADYGRNFESYVESGHRDLSVVLQVESAEAVENAAEIAGVEGVDALFVGPADLSASLDVFAEWSDEAFLEAVEEVLDAGEEAGVPVGTLGTTTEQIRALGSLGFDYLIAGADFTHLVEGQRRALEAADEVL
ncbi:aldolase [Natronomonas salina]|uniref:HpcH/HpaI aldolase family protein n=1 Tax=Natronomonas salina TaxID=1710540 RepID=UPI0015B4E787|nr:aldolase/citrate lyase family protein [Natronomonas salina]QLD89709.1 aldolase [Natronomonas salina]